jgi:hypothetical protein
MPQRDEPLTLGGVEAPFVQEHIARAQVLREFAPPPVPSAKEKRQFFGIFGGRRRAEPPPVVVVPPMAQSLPPQPPPAAAPSESASARESEGRPQPQAPADDLFADVAENDRFEIPAFLRRQAKMGS